MVFTLGVLLFWVGAGIIVVGYLRAHKANFVRGFTHGHALGLHGHAPMTLQLHGSAGYRKGLIYGVQMGALERHRLENP